MPRAESQHQIPAPPTLTALLPCHPTPDATTRFYDFGHSKPLLSEPWQEPAFAQKEAKTELLCAVAGEETEKHVDTLSVPDYLL